MSCVWTGTRSTPSASSAWIERAARTDGAAGEALALWSGAPLADVADEPFAAAEIRRLEALWLRASELAVDGDLAAGRDEEALGAQLDRLLEDSAPRSGSSLHAQRMLALYRSGRQAEALEAYVAARRRLVDDIGGRAGRRAARAARADPPAGPGPAPDAPFHRDRRERARAAWRNGPRAPRAPACS